MTRPLLSMLSAEECERFLDAAFRIVEEFGVRVTEREAVALLVRSGARRGDGGRLRMDRGRLRELLQSAPSRFRLHDRRGDSIEIGSGQSWTLCGGTVAQVADWPGFALRRATRDDVIRFARLCDALPLVHVVVPVAEAQDVGTHRAEAVTFAETLANTTKFTFVCPVKHSSARAWVQMGRIATSERELSLEPKIGLLATVLPDLYLDDECAATTLLAAREGIPLIAMAGPIAGSSAPNTIASTAALKLAGELFQAALAQLVRPGSPVLLDTGAVILDMNTADLGEAGPEDLLGVLVMAQALRALHLPSYSCALHCEAKTADFQAGLEKMAGMMAAQLAGVDLTTNIGMLSRCAVASCEQVVLDHELCCFVERLAQGVTVNKDTLALDVIREVGLGGNFLAHEHTLRHCRSGEMWYPGVLDRSATSAPRQSLYDRVHAEVERLLATHQPLVDEQVREELCLYAERCELQP